MIIKIKTPLVEGKTYLIDMDGNAEELTIYKCDIRFAEEPNDN